MSTVVQEDCQTVSKTTAARLQMPTWARRLAIVAVGCAAMAASGCGLANYLDTASATGADTAATDLSLG